MPHESLSFGNFQQDRHSNINEAKLEHDYLRIVDSALTDGHLDALRSMVLLVLREIDTLKKIDRPALPRPRPDEPIDLGKELAKIEKVIIRSALLRAKGNKAAAAHLLSMKPTTLHEKMKRHGMKVSSGS